MSNSGPTDQEKLRILSRDLWRTTLHFAFTPDAIAPKSPDEELTIVRAREIMYMLSQRMVEPSFLSDVKSKGLEMDEKMKTLTDQKEKNNLMALRHTMLQEMLISQIYLGGKTSGQSLVEEFGFGPGEQGYVTMQSMMAEHQNDPLISQYVGGSMVKVMEAGGVGREQMMAQSKSQ